MIYADYNGSAPLLPSVREYLKKRIDSDLFANPNAIHSMGQKVMKGLERCREIISSVMGCYPDQVIFNSGSSEGISHIVFSVLENAPAERRIILSSPQEHVVMPSVFNSYCERRGFTLVLAEIDEHGRVKIDQLREYLEKNGSKVALISIMAANNETGVIQPFEEIAKLANAQKIDYLCDTTQLIGKGRFHFENSGVSFAVCSGHKVGALPGTGFIMARDPQKLSSLVYGSSQEKGLRGGTQNYLGIETLAVALKDFQDHEAGLDTLKSARLNFEAQIKNQFPKAVVIAEKAERLAGTTLLGYPGLHGQAVQIELESQDIFVTTSAACSDNQPETSQILRAMGVDDQIGRSVIRISLSYSHGEKDYALLASALVSAYNKLGKIHSF
jgi:cysteine desulfurase